MAICCLHIPPKLGLMSTFKPYTPGKPRKKFSDAEKLDQVFTKFKELEWSLTDFLYKVFARTDGTGKAITRSQRHLQAVTASASEPRS